MLYAEVLATGSGIPERIIKNDHFDYLVEDADTWIHSRTGIRERRFVAPDQSTADLATAAARNALERGKSTPSTSTASSSPPPPPT